MTQNERLIEYHFSHFRHTSFELSHHETLNEDGCEMDRWLQKVKPLIFSDLTKI